jgi:hypothetical protein
MSSLLDAGITISAAASFATITTVFATSPSGMCSAWASPDAVGVLGCGTTVKVTPRPWRWSVT